MRAKATPWHSTREQIEVAISQSPARQTLNAGRAPESRIVQSCPLPREVQDLLPVICRTRLLKKSAPVGNALLARVVALGRCGSGHKRPSHSR